MRLALAVTLLLLSTALFAQTMVVHQADSRLRLNLAELDSIQFGEESALLPLSLDFSINRVGGAVNGERWRLEMTASLFDADGDPLLDGIPVRFEVEAEDSLVTTESGRTGNTSEDGASVMGIAFGGLFYPSRATNDTVTVTAVCEYGGEVFRRSQEIRLPGQQLTAELSVAPSDAYFTYPYFGYAQLWSSVVVLDGYGLPVKNELVQYSPEEGRVFESPTLLPGVDPVYRTTTDENGEASLYWIVRYWDVFHDPMIFETSSRMSVFLPRVPQVIVNPDTVVFRAG